MPESAARRRERAAIRRTAKIVSEHGSVAAFVVNRMMNTTISRILAQARARDRTKKWKESNRERKRRADDDRYERDKEAAAAAGVSYKDFMAGKREQNSEKPKYWAGRRIRERKAEDESFLIRTRLGVRLGEFMRLKNSSKARGTMELLGCNQSELLQHLRSQLRAGETLADMQADHIFAMGLYHPITEEMQLRVMNFSNLQPLSCRENVNKGKKLPTKAMAAKVARWAWPDGVTEDMLPDIYDGWATSLRMRVSE